MHIIDLSSVHESLFFQCLEEWSLDMREAGDQRANWYRAMLPNGLRVKLAITDDGVVAGFIQYLPVRYSILKGDDGYFISCIWVHGHKQGRGNLQHRGLGKAMLEAAEDEVKSLGGKGMAAWGLILPFWMKASWFRKHGYKHIALDGIASLLWKPFTEDALAPTWRKQLRKPEPAKGKLRISIFSYGWCSAINVSARRIVQISSEFPDKIILDEYDTRNREVMDSWGLSDAIFLNDKPLAIGPPQSYEKLRKLILKALDKL